MSDFGGLFRAAMIAGLVAAFGVGVAIVGLIWWLCSWF
jgi:hypothetical protein